MGSSLEISGRVWSAPGVLSAGFDTRTRGLPFGSSSCPNIQLESDGQEFIRCKVSCSKILYNRRGGCGGRLLAGMSLAVCLSLLWTSNYISLVLAQKEGVAG